MMKKLLALLLSVMMAASLTAPAFADGPDGPPPVDSAPGFWQENGEPVPVYTPGEAIPISAFLPEASNDSFLGIIGGADGPTAIISTFPSLNLDSVSSEPMYLDPDQYLASHPGLEEELKANAYGYFAEEYGFYWTAEEYMEIMDLTEEEFLDEMVWEQAYGLIRSEAAQTAIDATKEALGGVPGQVGVMVNGAYIQFPDAAPEIVGGTTMAPVRALVEALGGEASYQDGTVRFVKDKYAYEFTAGSTTVTVRPAGDGGAKPGTLDMGCAPYVKDGRTYVPVRFLAGALGYEVGWDSTFQTAILLDREAMAAKFDEQFTILNRVQANRAPALKDGESCSAGLKGHVTATAFDTLNGDTTYQADLTGRFLMNAEAASGTYSLKMSGSITDLLIGQYEDDMDEDVLARMHLLLDAVEDADVIMTRGGLAWVHSPALDELGGQENIWCGFDMGSTTLFAGMDASTVGTALAAMISTNSVMDYASSVGPAAQMLYELYGDDQFTTSGGVSTRTIGLDDLEALYPYGGMDEYKEFEMVLKVDSSGTATVTSKMETNARYGTPAMRITMDSTQNNHEASLTMTYHIANFGEMELTLTTTQEASTEQPMTEPPAGSTVVDAPALLDGYGGFNSAE